MANKSSVSAGGGIGFFGFLTIVFIVLKLTKVIAWSWLWVLAPLWVPTVLVLLIFGIIALIIYVIHKGD